LYNYLIIIIGTPNGITDNTQQAQQVSNQVEMSESDTNLLKSLGVDPLNIVDHVDLNEGFKYFHLTKLMTFTCSYRNKPIKSKKNCIQSQYAQNADPWSI